MPSPRSARPRGVTAVPVTGETTDPHTQAGGILAYPSGRALSPRTARPPRGRNDVPSGTEFEHRRCGGGGRRPGGGGPFEGWPCATPPCEERGAEHDATSTFQQTMTGEFRAGHGRLRSRTGREDQADATTGGSVVCRWRVPASRHDRGSRRLVGIPG